MGGGRIIGEACHAIDTCVALVQQPAGPCLRGIRGQRRGRTTADDKAFIVLRHANGSVSSMSYQTGGDAALPSERIEMFGGGRTAINESWARLRFLEQWPMHPRERGEGQGPRGRLLGVPGCLPNGRSLARSPGPTSMA